MTPSLDTDPAAAFRTFDADAATDVEAYRWTYFLPARVKLTAALSAVSGIDVPVMRDWLAQNDARYVIEAMQLDLILESVDEAWERLIANDVVPDNAEFPQAWQGFADTAGDLALLASDWGNVMAAQSLALEAMQHTRTWLGVDPSPKGPSLRWTRADDWSALSTLPREFAANFAPALWYFDDNDEDEDTGEFVDGDAAIQALLAPLRRAMRDAHEGWSRAALNSSCAIETIAALNFARFRDGERTDRPAAVALARRMPDLSRPLRAIRRLGYALLDCVIDGGEEVLLLGAPSFRWPAR